MFRLDDDEVPNGGNVGGLCVPWFVEIEFGSVDGAPDGGSFTFVGAPFVTAFLYAFVAIIISCDNDGGSLWRYGARGAVLQLTVLTFFASVDMYV